MARADIESRAEQLITPILDANGFELVDVEYVKEGAEWYLRAYIDKEGGITVNDCETVSRAFEQKLDEEDLISEAYTLEVSSPGLTRPLKKEKDYRRNLGRLIEIHLYKPVDPQTLRLKPEPVAAEPEAGAENAACEKDGNAPEPGATEEAQAGTGNVGNGHDGNAPEQAAPEIVQAGTGNAGSGQGGKTKPKAQVRPEKYKEFIGTLIAYDSIGVTIETDADEQLRINRADISVIRQYFEF